MNRKVWGATAVVALVVLPLVLRRPRAAAEIIGLLYSPDGETWRVLEGALLERPDVYLGISWVNRSDAELRAMVVLTLLDPDGEESEYPIEETLAPAEETTSSVFVSLQEGIYSFTVTIYEAETMRVLDTKTIPFTVAAPEPMAYIAEVLYQVGPEWRNLSNAKIFTIETLTIAVVWGNTCAWSVRGEVQAQVTLPDGSVVNLVPVSGQGDVVAVGAEGSVVFSPIIIDKENGCSLTAILSGEIA